MLDAEVAVIGLGAVGSMTLWNLARRGVSAIGFEQASSPNDRSGHAGETRLVVTLPAEETPDGEDEVLRHVLPAWDEFERETGRTVLTRQGGFYAGQEDKAMIRGFVANARKRFGEDSIYRRERAAADFPQFRLADDEVAVFDPTGSGVRSEWAVAGAVATAQGKGARVITDTRVLGWTAESSYVRVYTTVAEFKVGQVIVAPGAFAADLFPDLPVRARRLVKAWFAPEAEHLGTYSSSPLPIFTFGVPEEMGGFIYGAPSLDTPYVKIGGDFDWGYASPASSMDFAVTPEDLAGIRVKARTHFHGLTNAVVRSVKLMDGWTPDSEAIVGHYGSSGRVIVATGFSGHGFATSPLMGSVAADLATGVEPAINMAPYDPKRFSAGLA
jgi:sarcosine oxidase